MTFDFYSLVIYPNVKTDRINSFRKKYDPFIDTINPHISLIFPVKVPTDIEERSLISQIEKITDSWKKFI